MTGRRVGLVALGSTRCHSLPPYDSSRLISACSSTTFVMTNGSIVNTQHEFRRYFNIGCHSDIQTPRTIRRRVTSLRSTGKQMNKKLPGPRRSARTPENEDRVRQAIQRSPGRSARKLASESRLSDRRIRRILHVDLGLHCYGRPIRPSVTFLYFYCFHCFYMCIMGKSFKLYNYSQYVKDWQEATRMRTHPVILLFFLPT